MASNIKVDVVRPTATNGSLSLKGDSGGSATTNGVTVDSSGNTSITGTTTVSSLVATTADINGGTIDGVTLGTNSAVTEAQVDHININGNTISSTNTDGDINLTPNGNGSAVITSGGTGDALRITQTGTGNAFVVEDSPNPDSTPVVIDDVGNVILGKAEPDNTSTAAAKLQLHGDSGSAASFNQYTFANSAASAPFHILNKSNGTAIGVRGAVNDNDVLGVIAFNGDDGTNFIRGAQILGAVDGTPSSNDMPGRLVFSTTADGASSPTERMRIDSSGNLKFDSGYGSVATAYGCRAWVNFNGTGTVAIRASGNVSSITDNGTGDYTVNFTNAMPDANYAAVFGTRDSNYVMVIKAVSAAPTASSLRVATFDASTAGLADREYNNVAIFR